MPTIFGLVCGAALTSGGVGQAKILSAECRHKRMPRLIHRNADLFVPRMSGKGAAENFWEQWPMPVRGDGVGYAVHTAKFRKWYAEAAIPYDPMQQTILQDLLNGGHISCVLLERLFGHACGELVESIGIGRRNPDEHTPRLCGDGTSFGGRSVCNLLGLMRRDLVSRK